MKQSKRGARRAFERELHMEVFRARNDFFDAMWRRARALGTPVGIDEWIATVAGAWHGVMSDVEGPAPRRMRVKQ